MLSRPLCDCQKCHAQNLQHFGRLAHRGASRTCQAQRYSCSQVARPVPACCRHSHMLSRPLCDCQKCHAQNLQHFGRLAHRCASRTCPAQRYSCSQVARAVPACCRHSHMLSRPLCDCQKCHAQKNLGNSADQRVTLAYAHAIQSRLTSYMACHCWRYGLCVHD